jgi:PKD repeat protein
MSLLLQTQTSPKFYYMIRSILFRILLFLPAMINAQTWQPVGGGVSSTHGLTLWDGKLAVAGSFSSPCDRITAWDGSNYICFGSGVGLVARDAISFNGDLVVIGDFWNTHQPCTGCNGIARWDGSAWQPMGTGFNNDVLSITIWNGDLVVGGDFTEADGNPVSRIARWTGSTWVPIGGTNDFSYDIRGLTVYNGELWAGGDFIDVAGNSSYDRVVKWNGSAWVGGSQIGLPNGIATTVRCFYVDQAQNKLYMGGHFLEVNGNTNASGVAVYNGSVWSPLGGGVNDYVRALSKYNGNIIVGGNFSTAGSVNANKIAKWNPTSQTWFAMSTGMNDYVKALEVYNGWLYAGGPFTSASGSSINGIARWYEGTTGAPAAAFTASSLSICPGQCLTFTDNSTGTPTNWTWTFPGGSPSSSTTQNPGSVCFNTAGQYVIKLRVCNANGCDSVTQTVNVSAPVISAGQNVSICSGANTTLNATGGVSYTWSPAAGLSCTGCASPLASPAVTTTYTVTGTSASGCSSTSSVTVSVSPLPVVNAGSDVSICEGDTASLTATGGISYSWSPAASLSCSTCSSTLASPASTTTYVVTGSNAAGCMASDAVTVNILPAPNANAGTNQQICIGDTATLNAAGGISYSWSPSVNLSCQVCSITEAYPQTTTIYTVTVTGANGCTASDNVSVTVVLLPIANAGSDSSICTGDSLMLQASGGISYLWTPAIGLNCTNCQSPWAMPASNTTYIVTVTDVNGCSASASVDISLWSLPVIAAGTDAAICVGDTISLSASGAQSYQWFPAATLSCSSCQLPDAYPAATTIYSVTGADVNGCSNTASVTITVNPLPIADAGTDVSICSGSDTALLATGGDTYLWSPSSGLSCTACASPLASPAVTTTYTLIATDLNGCINSDAVIVTINALPVADAGTDVSICLGSDTALSANGGNTYLWSPSSGLSCTGCASPLASPGVTTTYTVVATDINGCINSDDVIVTVNALPVADAGLDDTLCYGESVSLLASGGIDYTWSPADGLSCTNCPNPISTPDSSVTYSVLVADANGCASSDEVTLVVLLCTNTNELDEQSVFVYSDPASGNILIQSRQHIDNVELYDLNGKLMLLDSNPGKDRLDISTSLFSPGVYLLRVRTSTSAFTTKVLVN